MHLDECICFEDVLLFIQRNIIIFGITSQMKPPVVLSWHNTWYARHTIQHIQFIPLAYDNMHITHTNKY